MDTCSNIKHFALSDKIPKSFCRSTVRAEGGNEKEVHMAILSFIFLQDGKSHDPLIHPPPSSDNFPQKDVISVGGCDFMREIDTLNKINSRYWKHTKRSKNRPHRSCAPQCFFQQSVATAVSFLFGTTDIGYTCSAP